MKNLSDQIYEWNKKLCNYYNPKRVVELKYIDNYNLYIKLYIRKTENILDDNFKLFFKNKENSTLLGSIVKKLFTSYKLEPVRGTSFKSFYNPDNWRRIEKDYIEYEYRIMKR